MVFHNFETSEGKKSAVLSAQILCGVTEAAAHLHRSEVKGQVRGLSTLMLGLDPRGLVLPVFRPTCFFTDGGKDGRRQHVPHQHVFRRGGAGAVLPETARRGRR